MKFIKEVHGATLAVIALKRCIVSCLMKVYCLFEVWRFATNIQLDYLQQKAENQIMQQKSSKSKTA